MTLVNRLKNEYRDRRARKRAERDLPHTEHYEKVRQLIPDLSDQEKEATYFELKRLLEKSSETVPYAENIFQSYCRLYEKEGGKIHGAEVLELGPGNNLAAGIYFVLAGASRYTAVDAVAAFPERPQEFYKNVIEEIRRHPKITGRLSIPHEDIRKIISFDSGVRWNSQKVRYVTPAYAEDLPFPDEHFDYIYSNASFEHFEAPGKVITSLYRKLKPGAVTVHTIDLRDHVDFEKPLEFLKLSRYSYRHASPYGTNRWRASDFENAFYRSGFQIREITINERRVISDAEYESFHSYFRENYSRTELELLGITIVATKP